MLCTTVETLVGFDEADFITLGHIKVEADRGYKGIQLT